MMQGAERLLTCPTLTSLSRQVYGPGIIKDLARLIFYFFFIFFFPVRAFAAGVTSARLSGDQPISAWLRCAAPQNDSDRRGRFPLLSVMKDFNFFAFAG